MPLCPRTPRPGSTSRKCHRHRRCFRPPPPPSPRSSVSPSARRATTPTTRRVWRRGSSPVGRSSKACTAASASGCILPLSVYGYFANGGSIAYICRIPNTEPAGQPARVALPAVDRALGIPLQIESVDPDANITIEVASVDSGPEAPDGPSPFNLTCCSTARRSSPSTNLTLGSGDRNVETRRQQGVHQDQGRHRAGQGGRPGQPARSAQAGPLRAGEGHAGSGAGHRTQVRRLRVHPQRHQRPRRRRRRDHGDRP